MKKIIRLTEGDLHRMVRESVKRVLNESNRYETYYRGYNSKYGSQKTHLLWLSDDIGYARGYGNRVEEVIVDDNKLNLACLEDMYNILGGGFDYYIGPVEEQIKTLLDEGYNGYDFYTGEDDSYCVCLFSSDPIVSRRELSREEFEKIEMYDHLSNPQYDADYDELSDY